MGEQVLLKTKHQPLVLFSFYFLLFSYPLLSLLWRRSYPLLTIEVGVFFLLLAVVCILLTIVLGHVRPVIVNVLTALLITISLTLQFDLLTLGLALCISMSLVAVGILRTKFQLYALPVLFTMILGAYFDSFENDGYVDSSEKQTSVNSELPPIVHILLDGFIGIDGLPPYPESEFLSDVLYTFFDEHKFKVFPSAYSRFQATGVSLYSAFNFKNNGESRFGFEVPGQRKHVLRSNSQFDVMQKLGYRFSIYQTDYLDFCQSNPRFVDRCWEYTQPNIASIQMVTGVKLKLQMLLKTLVNQSTFLTDLVVSNRWFLDQGIAFHDPRIFSELERDLLGDSGGSYFFVHVLLPHGPFAFLRDCSISYESPLWARYGDVRDEPVQNDEVYEVRTMKYFEQIGCALMSMSQVFEKMKMTDLYDRSIIVVHGDHGSRIGKFRPAIENLEAMTPVEYRAFFSTLFAVKFPGTKGQVDKRVLPLSTLMEEFTSSVESGVLRHNEVEPMETLQVTQLREGLFVFVPGTYPMWKVDVNIFEDEL